MDRFSIKDLENLTGIKAHTIRVWEQRYGILQPKRTATNIRYYDADDLKLALRIALLNNYGFKISRIREMNAGEMTALIGKIADPAFRLQLQVNEMIERTLDMDPFGLEEKINTFIGRHGLEVAVEQLLFQYLEKIGIMWITDRLEPSQEHMAANIIFRKIAAAADALKPTQEGSKVLLFLPEGEFHDISLMYVFYLLRKAGKSPVYFGSNTPLGEVQRCLQKQEVHCLYVHLTTNPHPAQTQRYLQKLSDSIPQALPCYVSGAALGAMELPQLPNLHYLHTLTAVRDKITSL